MLWIQKPVLYCCLLRTSWGWREAGEAQVVKSTWCYCRRPGFGSWCPHISSHLSVTAIPGVPIPSSGLYVRCICTRRQDAHTHKNKSYSKKGSVACQNTHAYFATRLISVHPLPACGFVVSEETIRRPSESWLPQLSCAPQACRLTCPACESSSEVRPHSTIHPFCN